MEIHEGSISSEATNSLTIATACVLFKCSSHAFCRVIYYLTVFGSEEGHATVQHSRLDACNMANVEFQVNNTF